MAIKAKFFPGAGLLSETGDDVDNTIVTSRDAARQILVNGGAARRRRSGHRRQYRDDPGVR
jgi:hypothetical protein